MYLDAVPTTFGHEVDYCQLIKIYGTSQESEVRYSPPHCIGIKAKEVLGYSNAKNVSTSYVERQNLTMRMNMRRFTRLSNAFSEKVENLRHAIALHFMYYNFYRIHQSLRITPAMKAKVTDHLWEVEDILNLLNS